jgi:hypothetical protein
MSSFLFVVLYEIHLAMFCSKAVNNAVDLFKYFGSKGSVIRYMIISSKNLDALMITVVWYFGYDGTGREVPTNNVHSVFGLTRC